MGRIPIEKCIKDLACFACPVCRGTLSVIQSDKKEEIVCTQCNNRYQTKEDIACLIPAGHDQIKSDIQAFWGALYDAAYKEGEHMFNASNYQEKLEELYRLFKHRNHLAVVEMPVEQLKGKKVLEIGSGAGGHSALFSYKGAHMYSMDLTLDRVASTAKKLEDIENNPDFVCLQADAEILPFPDNYFDIVYSNGVLHHSPDTYGAVQEAYRVLKPGGKAVIMLYARDSFYYWAVLFLKNVLTGNIFRHKNWLGRTTEWMSDKRQKIENPETKVFSKNQIHKLFHRFSNVKIRKNSFVFHQIPIIGKIISRWLGKKTGFSDAGHIIYGQTWRNETRFELIMSNYIGFALSIKAEKS